MIKFKQYLKLRGIQFKYLNNTIITEILKYIKRHNKQINEKLSNNSKIKRLTLIDHYTPVLFEVNNNCIMKISNQQSQGIVAMYLKLHPIDYVMNIYDVFKLNVNDKKSVYIIFMQKLKQLSDVQLAIISNYLEQFKLDHDIVPD